MGVYLYTDTDYTPTANTLAYFPLVNDIKDKVGTATITAGVTPVKSTIGFTFAAAGGNTTTINGANFWSVWSKANSLNSTYIGGLIAKGSVGYYYKHAESNLNKRFFIFYTSSFSRVSSNQTSIGTGDWHHICFGNSNGTWTFFLDGSQFYSQSTRQPYGTTYEVSLCGANDGTDTFDISELIVEDTCWTLAQVSDYYNLTKGNYGIS